MPVSISTNEVSKGDGSAKLIVYAGLSETDTSPGPIELLEWADRSIHVSGTFNAGTVVIEGSNNGTSWVTLTDPQGNPLSITSEKIEQVSEVTRYLRPRVSAGTGVAVNVHIAVRRASNMRA